MFLSFFYNKQYNAIQSRMELKAKGIAKGTTQNWVNHSVRKGLALQWRGAHYLTTTHTPTRETERQYKIRFARVLKKLRMIRVSTIKGTREEVKTYFTIKSGTGW